MRLSTGMWKCQPSWYIFLLIDRTIGATPGVLARAEGAGMDLEAALPTALRAKDAVELAQKPRRPLGPRGESLTRREVEVLALVGEGCSDGDIAERLCISNKGTASVHVANIKVKVGTEGALRRPGGRAPGASCHPLTEPPSISLAPSGRRAGEPRW